MSDIKTTADAEFSAMQTLYSALEPLDDDARSRVITYIIARLEIATQANSSVQFNASFQPEAEEGTRTNEEKTTALKYSSFAELFDAAHPKTNADKALVAGYWLQVCQGAETFDGHSANKELKHLGEGLVNITNAVESLKTQKPALALQLKKSGKAQQARKVYKVTVAGIKAIQDMINI